MRIRTRRSYEPAFREEAVALLERTDRPLNAVASSLGVPRATLRLWYEQEMARRRGKPKEVVTATTPETLQQKLQRLERENAALRKKVEDLQLDRDILKKAAAFFVKESE
jgi:transposase